MAYIQCVSWFFSIRNDISRELALDISELSGSFVRPSGLGTLPGERDEAYPAALQSSSSNLHPPSGGCPIRGFGPACGERSRTMGVLTLPSPTFPLCTEMHPPAQWTLCNVWGDALSRDCQRGIFQLRERFGVWSLHGARRPSCP